MSNSIIERLKERQQIIKSIGEPIKKLLAESNARKKELYEWAKENNICQYCKFNNPKFESRCESCRLSDYTGFNNDDFDEHI